MPVIFEISLSVNLSHNKWINKYRASTTSSLLEENISLGDIPVVSHTCFLILEYIQKSI